jgi:hypothetical protein
VNNSAITLPAKAGATGYLVVESSCVTVSWGMLDGSGNPITTAYLNFQLWNCSGQVAEVIGYPAAIVQQQFTLTANPTTGIVSGTFFGNNQISCGNVQSTEWIVQQFKATNQPSGIAQYYCLNSPTTFNPATAQPPTVGVNGGNVSAANFNGTTPSAQSNYVA